MHKIAIPQAAIDRVLKRRNSLHVFNDIDPARTAHIVVDLQNGFMARGSAHARFPSRGTSCPTSIASAPRCAPPGGLVVYIQNTIDVAAKEAWSELVHLHVRRGSDGRPAWMPHLPKAATVTRSGPGSMCCPADVRVKKNRFGAFVPGSSQPALRPAGACHRHRHHHRDGDQCVLQSTARDAMMMNYKVIFVVSATATYNDEEHNATLGIMLAMFADVMTTEEVVERLAGDPKARQRSNPPKTPSCPALVAGIPGTFMSPKPQAWMAGKTSPAMNGSFLPAVFLTD